MKKNIYLLLLIALCSCNSTRSQNSNNNLIEQSALSNSKIKGHVILDCMYEDSYFPKFLVDKCKNILLNLCADIETTKPANLNDLYKLTHSSTDQLNNLQNNFFENNSEIETGARECLAINFEFIASAYGFKANMEELIATREW